MGCLRRIGCLVLVVILIGAAWLYRGRWMPLFHHGGTGSASGALAPAATWEPLTADGAARAKAAVEKLGTRSGPVFANIQPGDLAAYVFQELSKQLPPSAEHVQAAAVGERLAMRADIKVSDFGDTRALGPLAGVLGDRAPVQFGGTLDVVRPGLAQYRVQSLHIRDLAIPTPMIPELLHRLEHGARPAGVQADALPLAVPPYIADVRVHDGTITLYKAVP